MTESVTGIAGVAPRVVVVGSGIAGLIAALHAAASGCHVTVVTKDVLEHANTRYAQGGIAGVMFADDRADDHLRDTLTAGAGLGDPAAVRVLVDEGPMRIRELVALGVDFDRQRDGSFVKGLEAAHSYPRILHAGGDATGSVIELALVARLRESGARVIEHGFLLGLVRTGERVTGVELLIDPDGTAGPAAGVAAATRQQLHADAVILATGGAGELYSHTTNPSVATGDGIAVALRAGADVADLEFFQFHPTVMPAVAGADAFLVSEAVRGEGATLIDDTGRRFAFDDHPDGELAPRDVVARSIATQMQRQGGRPVRLDATGIRPTRDETAAFLASRFPTIDAAVRARGLDWARDPIPVTPAAHYLMGGIVTDLSGRTSVPGLYAVGEVARTGVHGANRLASNSLLEGAVFGARAGDAVAADLSAGAWPVPATPVPAPAVPATLTPSPPVGTARPSRSADAASPESQNATGEQRATDATFTREALQELMWAEAGLVRDEDGLTRAAQLLAAWRHGLQTPSEPRSPGSAHPVGDPAPVVAALEDENLLLLAEHLVAAARARRTSVGAHFRSDAALTPAVDAETPRIDTEPGAEPRPTAHDDARPWSSASATATHIPTKEAVAC